MPSLKSLQDDNENKETSCSRYIANIGPLRNQVMKDNEQSNCYRSTLTIKDTKMDDEIVYVLVAENREGKMEHSIRLNVSIVLNQKFKKTKKMIFSFFDLNSLIKWIRSVDENLISNESVLVQIKKNYEITQ